MDKNIINASDFNKDYIESIIERFDAFTEVFSDGQKNIEYASPLNPDDKIVIEYVPFRLDESTLHITGIVDGKETTLMEYNIDNDMYIGEVEDVIEFASEENFPYGLEFKNEYTASADSFDTNEINGLIDTFKQLGEHFDTDVPDRYELSSIENPNEKIVFERNVINDEETGAVMTLVTVTEERPDGSITVLYDEENNIGSLHNVEKHITSESFPDGVSASSFIDPYNPGVSEKKLYEEIHAKETGLLRGDITNEELAEHHLITSAMGRGIMVDLEEEKAVEKEKIEAAFDYNAVDKLSHIITADSPENEKLVTKLESGIFDSEIRINGTNPDFAFTKKEIDYVREHYNPEFGRVLGIDMTDQNDAKIYNLKYDDIKMSLNIGVDEINLRNPNQFSEENIESITAEKFSSSYKYIVNKQDFNFYNVAVITVKLKDDPTPYQSVIVIDDSGKVDNQLSLGLYNLDEYGRIVYEYQEDGYIKGMDDIGLNKMEDSPEKEKLVKEIETYRKDATNNFVEVNQNLLENKVKYTEVQKAEVNKTIDSIKSIHNHFGIAAEGKSAVIAAQKYRTENAVNEYIDTRDRIPGVEKGSEEEKTLSNKLEWKCTNNIINKLNSLVGTVKRYDLDGVRNTLSKLETLYSKAGHESDRLETFRQSILSLWEVSHVEAKKGLIYDSIEAVCPIYPATREGESFVNLIEKAESGDFSKDETYLSALSEVFKDADSYTEKIVDDYNSKVKTEFEKVHIGEDKAVYTYTGFKVEISQGVNNSGLPNSNVISTFKESECFDTKGLAHEKIALVDKNSVVPQLYKVYYDNRRSDDGKLSIKDTIDNFISKGICRGVPVDKVERILSKGLKNPASVIVDKCINSKEAKKWECRGRVISNYQDENIGKKIDRKYVNEKVDDLLKKEQEKEAIEKEKEETAKNDEDKEYKDFSEEVDEEKENNLTDDEKRAMRLVSGYSKTNDEKEVEVSDRKKKEIRQEAIREGNGDKAKIEELYNEKYAAKKIELQNLKEEIIKQKVNLTKYDYLPFKYKSRHTGYQVNRIRLDALVGKYEKAGGKKGQGEFLEKGFSKLDKFCSFIDFTSSNIYETAILSILKEIFNESDDKVSNNDIEKEIEDDPDNEVSDDNTEQEVENEPEDKVSDDNAAQEVEDESDDEVSDDNAEQEVENASDDKVSDDAEQEVEDEPEDEVSDDNAEQEVEDEPEDEVSDDDTEREVENESDDEVSDDDTEQEVEDEPDDEVSDDNAEQEVEDEPEDEVSDDDTEREVENESDDEVSDDDTEQEVEDEPDDEVSDDDTEQEVEDEPDDEVSDDDTEQEVENESDDEVSDDGVEKEIEDASNNEISNDDAEQEIEDDTNNGISNDDIEKEEDKDDIIALSEEIIENPIVDTDQNEDVLISGNEENPVIDNNSDNDETETKNDAITSEGSHPDILKNDKLEELKNDFKSSGKNFLTGKDTSSSALDKFSNLVEDYNINANDTTNLLVDMFNDCISGEDFIKEAAGELIHEVFSVFSEPILTLFDNFTDLFVSSNLENADKVEMLENSLENSVSNANYIENEFGEYQDLIIDNNGVTSSVGGLSDNFGVSDLNQVENNIINDVATNDVLSDNIEAIKNNIDNNDIDINPNNDILNDVVNDVVNDNTNNDFNNSNITNTDNQPAEVDFNESQKNSVEASSSPDDYLDKINSDEMGEVGKEIEKIIDFIL